MRTTSIPSRDELLMLWSDNIAVTVSAAPATYNVTSAQAASYSAVSNAYKTAYMTAITPATRTKITVANKNTARRTLKAAARLFVKLLESNPGLTDGMRQTLGLNIPNPPSPVPAPDYWPTVTVKTVVRNTVNLKLQGPDSTRRGLPVNVSGAQIWSFAGENPPQDINAWRYEGMTKRATAKVELPLTLPAFSRVWFSAQYFNNRGEMSPASPPISINLGSFVVQLAA